MTAEREMKNKTACLAIINTGIASVLLIALGTAAAKAKDGRRSQQIQHN